MSAGTELEKYFVEFYMHFSTKNQIYFDKEKLSEYTKLTQDQIIMTSSRIPSCYWNKTQNLRHKRLFTMHIFTKAVHKILYNTWLHNNMMKNFLLFFDNEEFFLC